MEKFEISDISYEGAGVGKLDGKVVFVPKSLPGEVVEANIVKQTNSYCVANVTKVVKPSDKRVTPPCVYYNECSGCAFQHCDEDCERALKIQILKNELKKVGYSGKIDFVSSDKRLFYRNKLKLEVRGNKLGYIKAGSREFLPVTRCLLASEKINAAITTMEQFLKQNALKNLKSVYFKQVGEKVAICFLFDKKSQKTQKIAKNLQIFDKFSVFFAYGDVLESDKTDIFCVYGDDKLSQQIQGVEIETDVSGFNQVNDFVADKLYQKVCEFAKGKRVVNAYSGQGLLTHLLSKVAKFVYGIEYQKSAHLAAEKICKSSNIKNICGKVEDELGKILLADFIDLLVLDPAREGCERSVLEKLNNSQSRTICYISCNFASLCRDCKILESNYKIQEITIFDMFPSTANMEVFAVLERV